MKKNIILFGAGKNGILALKKYGKERVACFCDNNPNILKTEIEGIQVISFEEMVKLHGNNYIIVVTPYDNLFMIGQLEQAGIYDYLVFPNSMHTIIQFDEHTEASFWDSKIEEYVVKCRRYDWLDDISQLKIMVDEVLSLYEKSKQIPAHSGRLREGFYYGNLQTLFQFAGAPADMLKYSPSVCHVNAFPALSAEFYRSAVIVSGTYYKEKIHKRYPYVPVFTVGPYIYYAQNFYSQEKLQETKKAIGKMLLVMLPHSLENTTRTYKKGKFIDDILMKYRDQFDSIWLCALWIDINDPVCQYAESCGLHVISAGFRFDEMFNVRLRTAIELCDALVCGDIGTFIQYALCLGKPVGRIEISEEKPYWEVEDLKETEKKVQMTKEYFSIKTKFFEIFDDQLTKNEKKINWAEPLAGFDQIRSREYMQCIFEISRDIWIQSKGILDDYPKAVRDIFFKYNMENDIEKMFILKQAVGGYVD